MQNWPFFIARRLFLSKQRSFSKLIVRLAAAGVALSVAVMLISLATITGFREGIRAKVVGFAGHLVVNALNNNNSLELIPIAHNRQVEEKLWKLPGVKSVCPVAQKPGIIKADEDLDGIVLKGVDTSYRWDFLKESLIVGKLPRVDDTLLVPEVLISKYTARRLSLDTGMKLRVLFIRVDSAGRNRTAAVAPLITGIYDTGLEEQDRLMAYTSLNTVQRVLGSENLITQWEVHLAHDNLIREATEVIHQQIPPDLRAWSVFEQQPQIFEWLSYLDTNVEIIITLMVLVASINMCIALLILIMERTNMIGLMKAFGASNRRIRSIFLYHSAYIILTGLFVGNLAGIGLCWLQKTFGFIRLPRETYYVDRVLVEVVPWHVALVNAGTFLMILLVLFLPAMIISGLSPARTIRFN
jgi:lipoprotein-releasing system permease protein